MIELTPQTSVTRPLWTLIGPGLGAVVAAFQLAMPLALLRTLQRDLHFTGTALAVFVVSQVIAVALGLALGYALGRRAPTSVVLSGLALMLVGAGMTALSGTSALMVIAGMLAGLGGGAVLGSAAGLAGQVGERREPARLALGLAAFGGLMAGPVIGWFVTRTASWRLAYLLTVPMILIALITAAVVGVVALARPRSRP